MKEIMHYVIIPFMKSLFLLFFCFVLQALSGHASVDDKSTKHILFVSDSHGVTPFGKVIHQKLLKRADLSFDFVAIGGSAPFQWLPSSKRFVSSYAFEDYSFQPNRSSYDFKTLTTPTLQALIRRQVPDVIIINHGTNYAMKRRLTETEKQFHIRTSTQLIQQIPLSSECIWIGPPKMSKEGYSGEALQERYNIIEKSIQKASANGSVNCRLIDSRKYSEYPKGKGDGIHYPRSQEVNEWAYSIWGLLDL